MQVYGIKKRLNIPEYKITEIISESDTGIDLKIASERIITKKYQGL